MDVSVYDFVISNPSKKP